MSYSLSWSNSIGVYAPSNPVSVDKLPIVELVQMCQTEAQTNRSAFAELMRRNQSYVDQVLYKLAPDWQDRADLAQEVWLRVYRNIKRLQEPEKFRGWLSRIATNLFYDELRKRKRVGGSVSLDAPFMSGDGDEMSWDLPSAAPSPIENMSTQEFYEELRRAIQDLPSSFRETIVLREIQGLSYEEISEITGVSLGTVKSRIARARLKLQAQLQPYLSNM
ncbi:sigma-70 family RNA polymerase sigma factor [Pseudanabaena sp. 'Roaring Creek']|uniref:sigma-70 family RNA polymerase sigma factor n=1 Tax=Pseudanabaena sp. 'Roaring Creek' TaxID=1681830 RepID=UPI0006D7F357|nr:sigma-70 family RNA polymerase sigma factor [Pseudanabaena sp. 'Roaring Creek']